MWIIHKQILEATDRQALLLPEGAEILSVGNQREEICIWYKCNPDADKVSRKFAVVGTGYLIDNLDNYKLIGCVHLLNSSLIFHIFEIV